MAFYLVQMPLTTIFEKCATTSTTRLAIDTNDFDAKNSTFVVDLNDFDSD